MEKFIKGLREALYPKITKNENSYTIKYGDSMTVEVEMEEGSQARNFFGPILDSLVTKEKDTKFDESVMEGM